jgi:chromosome segregation ATPase
MQAMLNRDRADLESTKRVKSEQVAEQQRKLKSLDARLAKLSFEVNSLSAADASEKGISDMRQRISGLQGEIRRLQEENRQGQLRREQFEKQNAELEKQIALLVDLVTQYSK